MKYPRCFRQERDLNLQDAVRYERGQKTGRWDRLRFLKQFLESLSNQFLGSQAQIEALFHCLKVLKA